MVTKVPSYRYHEASGKAVVTLSGRDYYLGQFNSADSKRQYKKLVAEYLPKTSLGIAKADTTIRDVLVRLMQK